MPNNQMKGKKVFCRLQLVKNVCKHFWPFTYKKNTKIVLNETIDGYIPTEMFSQFYLILSKNPYMDPDWTDDDMLTTLTTTTIENWKCLMWLYWNKSRNHRETEVLFYRKQEAAESEAETSQEKKKRGLEPKLWRSLGETGSKCSLPSK